MCDDEPQIVRALRVILSDAGYEVRPAAGLAEALSLLEREPPDGAIIDIVLHDGDGIELCRELRTWSAMPVIVISALGEEEQKVRALQAGADDYITKPFLPRELLARLEAVFRRVGDSAEQAVLTIGGLEINFAAHTVRRDGREVRLTPLEFKLLAVLAHNRGRPMSTRALLGEIWGPERVDAGPLLRTHIANLRYKIEPDDAPARRYIRTEPGVGYRFCE